MNAHGGGGGSGEGVQFSTNVNKILFVFLAKSFVNYFVSSSRYNMHQQTQTNPKGKNKTKFE
jgi:hypothetical protein